MPSRDPLDLCPLLQEFFPKLKAKYEEINPGCELFLTHTLRTPVEQLTLFVQGRLPAYPGPIVTWKDGFVNKSKHNEIPAEAFDIAVKIDGKVCWDDDLYIRIGALVPALGYQDKIRWGGIWKSRDLCHFETKI